MANHLKKITARAKQLQKKHPGSKWITLIKKASAEYRSGKIGSVKRKKTRRGAAPKKKRTATPRRVKRVAKRRSRTARINSPGKLNGITAGQLTGELRRRLKDKLARNLLKREMATSAKSHRSAQNMIVDTRRQLNRL